MNLSNDIKSVLRELSPILAGFKLALVITSWFGVGSIASWIVKHWYPFTRFLWDLLTDFIFLPRLDNIVKDSLTALVFFLPLGIAAIFNKNEEISKNERTTHRALGVIFGIIIVYVICKDVFSELMENAATMNLKDNPIVYFMDYILLYNFDLFFKITVVLYTILCTILGCVLGLKYYFSTREKRVVIRSFLGRAVDFLYISIRKALSVKLLFRMYLILISATSILFLFVSSTGSISLFVSISLLFLIMFLLIISVLYAPRKLFIATGAAIAFVGAALCFELAVIVINFIEKTSG